MRLDLRDIELDLVFLFFVLFCVVFCPGLQALLFFHAVLIAPFIPPTSHQLNTLTSHSPLVSFSFFKSSPESLLIELSEAAAEPDLHTSERAAIQSATGQSESISSFSGQLD